jgi:hypothetical protein
VTDSFGFLQAPLHELTAFFDRWLGGLRPTIRSEFRTDLTTALERLGGSRASRVLLAETRSEWVAVLVDRRDSFHSEVYHPARSLPCRGLCIRWFPHTIDQARRQGHYGAITFQTLADHPIDFLQVERSVDVGCYERGWKFTTSGPVLPFEQTERYSAYKIRDRFTPEMLDTYCRAFGIEAFRPEFYGPAFVLFDLRRAEPSAAVDRPAILVLGVISHPLGPRQVSVGVRRRRSHVGGGHDP